MKIQIITLWSADNYGAYFQAFALKTYLQMKYPSAEISFLRDTKEEKHRFSWISKSVKKSLYQYKLQREFNKARDEFCLSDIGDTIDICIIGADEVWNVSNTFFEHIGAYVGIGVKGKKCIAYAPSSNGVEKKQFTKVYGETPFVRFNAISVRDKATQYLVSELSAINPPVVLDPTFLIDIYNDILINTKFTKYLIVYGYSFTDEEIFAIKKIAKEKKLTIVSAGAYQVWTDIKIPASPKQFLGLIKNAEYVVTSTFHGTVFSILFNKEFVSYTRNSPKILEILEAFDLTERNASDETNINRIFSHRIDYDHVNKIIDEKRKQSTYFLQKEVTLDDK